MWNNLELTAYNIKYSLIGISPHGLSIMPKLMTLNDLEWRDSHYFALLHSER